MFDGLIKNFNGEIFLDEKMRTLYSTDASAYKELPLAVCYPKDEADLQRLIAFAHKNKISLIPRTAGTSLAGQVVGDGIIVDVSKYFTEVLEINSEENFVRVQAGVVRNELNQQLEKHGKLFGPITSTANRAMMGGMLGNNSCGQNSLRYGSVRDKLISVKGFLSDGLEVEFKSLSEYELETKLSLESLEGDVYRKLIDRLRESHAEIIKAYPHPEIHRRNTGYGLDILAAMKPFFKEGEDFNLAKLIAGSEGTLLFVTEMTLEIEPLPSKFRLLLCPHFDDINKALEANILSLKYDPMAVELMDRYILECTAGNRMYKDMRFFVQGDPEALLLIELDAETEEDLKRKSDELSEELDLSGLCSTYSIVEAKDIAKVWALRSAGLGLLSNVPGDAKAVPVIEDTCVRVADLPEYIKEFNVILDAQNLYCVHYAHAGSGELHLRPIIDLKTVAGHRQFREIAEAIVHLVKKYRGSLSGEHGDGRLRGEFIESILGKKVYSFLLEVKQVFDPNNIYNKGKIVNTPAMDQDLRYQAGELTPEFENLYDFSHEQGYLPAAEFCNGSGDCRKSALMGGTMCPSFMAEKAEQYTTRARANILREYLRKPFVKSPFEHPEIADVMDSCLSCKACKSECPSNVDMAKLKSEFLYQKSKHQGFSLRSLIIAHSHQIVSVGAYFPRLFNFLNKQKFVKSFLRLSQKRDLPTLSQKSFRSWFRTHVQEGFTKKVYFFVDEVSDYYESDLAIKAVKLLNHLGYAVLCPEHAESGRAAFSKGVLDHGKRCAERNVQVFSRLVSSETPLIGLEPSTLLCFRDEYIDILRGAQKQEAKEMAQHSYLLDEFLSTISSEIAEGLFTDEVKSIEIHAHCFQKSLAKPETLTRALSIPKNFNVKLISSGCCGMAGSFGYEDEHEVMSEKIANLTLIPHVKQMHEQVILVASGTSCRHQVKDLADREALHPVEVLFDAMRN
ncbi:FAD-binding and (Fe-S)-binding domain-containing protein [Lentisphaera profundi]|uniref:FAD-binding and (Fe-S)-binding domain-containing protein n=1 Tax=Lentisphaera profundi TaxID=1658616 RepID=A0ABY7VZB4_9BACT|nr:FAD-binding and (Fe-S)-binding domain-containing protein [Lentisphaera profundi]WDE99139.1 FAD-binding and (Fe-S)-binding domain-containing protein [Lentisphaera profundi]